MKKLLEKILFKFEFYRKKHYREMPMQELSDLYDLRWHACCLFEKLTECDGRTATKKERKAIEFANSELALIDSILQEYPEVCRGGWYQRKDSEREK